MQVGGPKFVVSPWAGITSPKRNTYSTICVVKSTKRWRAAVKTMRAAKFEVSYREGEVPLCFLACCPPLPPFPPQVHGCAAFLCPLAAVNIKRHTLSLLTIVCHTAGNQSIIHTTEKYRKSTIFFSLFLITTHYPALLEFTALTDDHWKFGCVGGCIHRHLLNHPQRAHTFDYTAKH
jgi:hypothetical protein